MSDEITVVIPSIPPRRDMLNNRAIASVLPQTLCPAGIVVALDRYKEGAGPTRNKGIEMVQTEWLAFLDDDDELLHHHLETLWVNAQETGADVVWPWFERRQGDRPVDQVLPHKTTWDPMMPHTFPITTLVRTELAKDVKFRPPENPNFSGEDWHFWLELSQNGAKFSHVDEITWVWHVHFSNTSGAPGRW